MKLYLNLNLLFFFDRSSNHALNGAAGPELAGKGNCMGKKVSIPIRKVAASLPTK